jgi:hypothetical protein
MRRFWASVVLGGLLISIGSALLLSAYKQDASDGLPQPWTGDGGTILMGCSSIFSACEEFDPTRWYAAGTGLLLTAALLLTVAARTRARG